MSFNAIQENKTITKIFGFTVFSARVKSNTDPDQMALSEAR